MKEFLFTRRLKIGKLKKKKLIEFYPYILDPIQNNFGKLIDYLVTNSKILFHDTYKHL